MSDANKQFWLEFTRRVAPWASVILAAIALLYALDQRGREAMMLGQQAVANSTNAVTEIRALRADIRAEFREVNNSLRNLSDLVIEHGVRIKYMEREHERGNK